jgi:glucose-1-phosphate adenylyltransferase
MIDAASQEVWFMKKKECIAMVLAGGRGARLGALTDCLAKPMLFYGGNHRIIDFTLTNCSRSGIDTVGVLTQYLSDGLHTYLGDGRAWNLSGLGKGLFTLPSDRDAGEEGYRGTADAVFRNIHFIDQADPLYLCVLSGDHIYKMDYAQMLDFHKKKGADATLAGVHVPWSQTDRYGVIHAEETGLVRGFEEKPRQTRSNLASMGVYIFNWPVLRRQLLADSQRRGSRHDFGMDVIPAMLAAGEALYTYRFDGYWRDVGTVESLWEANMDLVQTPPKFVIHQAGSEVFSSWFSPYDTPLTQPLGAQPPCLSRKSLAAGRNILSSTDVVLGRVERSVLSDSVVVEEGAEVVESVLMPNVYIGKNAKVHRAVVGPGSQIMDGAVVGADSGVDAFVSDQLEGGVSLIASWVHVAAKTKLQKNSHVANGVSIYSASTRSSDSFFTLKRHLRKPRFTQGKRNPFSSTSGTKSLC